MKRILKAGTVCMAVSMLFTGCGSGSLVSGISGGYQDIKWDVVETQENKEMLGNSGLKDGETLPAKEMPDYYEVQSAEKAEEPEGTPAFKMKDGHSDDARDIESFEVGAMQQDGTFIYCYSTRAGEYVESEDDNRPYVHCMAAYNYKTGQFKVIHEKSYAEPVSVTDEDSRSFYMQMCNSDGTGDMFVYDCGLGYLYDSTGEEKFITSIEEFVREHFNGYSVVATEALMEGGSRIYVDLVIEKEEITSVDETMDDEDTSEEDADDEAEKLDEEFDSKTLEVVLVYDFEKYSSSIDQSNLMLDTQAAWWQLAGALYSGDVGELPSAEEDWNTVTDSIPNQWGPAFLYGLRNWSEDEREAYGITDTFTSGTPVFQWNGEKTFGYRDDGYVSDFIPQAGSYQPFTDLQNNTELNNIFVLKDGHYYEVYGTTGNDLGEGDYGQVRYTREISRKDESVEEDGTKETTTTIVTQSIAKNRKRDTYPDGSYLEGYWIMDSCDSVFDIVDEEVFGLVGTTDDDTDYDVIQWIKSDGDRNGIAKVAADSMVDIFKDNGSLYMAVAYEGGTSISKLKNDTKEIESSQDILSADISDMIKKVAYKGADVDSKYHDAYKDMSSQGESLDENAGEYLDGKNVLHVSLSNTHKDLLQKIEDYKLAEIKANHKDIEAEEIKQLPEYVDAAAISEVGSAGYLITSFAHGLVYYDPAAKKAISLDDGTWYGTWRSGDTFVSVGFGKENNSYGSLDIAHSRVKEYRIEDLYKSGIEAIAESMELTLPMLEKEQSEGTKTMQEDYNKEMKDEEVVFVDPNENEWKENTPGGELKKIEDERREQKEKEKKAREDAGEWDPADEYWYGEKRLGNSSN